MPAVKKRKQNEEDLPEEQEADEEADDEQMESDEGIDEDADDEQMESNNGIQVNVYEDTLVVELPRDGTEAETLSRLSQFVDGL